MTILCTKIINIGLDLLELFEHVTGFGVFLTHSVCCNYTLDIAAIFTC